ncbi:unnamed protein product [Knipowitschia caucasica]|uniref:Uncharacterized protein n=1 Tax=Knipowitschia caucasica TaxID=637954 RepID=A0AAV2MPV3_KNICA
MEDVVLHYKSGPDQDLSTLIGTTEKLLAPFPCRPPQVFSPWFPSIVDRHLPLRPARPPPRIPSTPDPIPETRGINRPTEDSNQTTPTKGHVNSTEIRGLSPSLDQPEEDRGILLVPETPPDPGLQVQTKPETPSKRCWTVFRHRVRTKDQSRVQIRVQTSSRRFLQTVSKLQLQDRQRVKWIIDKNNCRDMEQVWRSLCRPTASSLPSSCNAHMNRDQAQIWVYCDVVQSEAVGLTLKQELSLRGTISLWERIKGHIYSL